VSLNRVIDRYLAFGLGCMIVGAPFAAFSWFILRDTALTALGLACAVLGATVALVPNSPVPKQTVRSMVEGSCVNVEALLEELDVKSKALYLPPRDGRVYVYAPLRENVSDEVLAWVVNAPTRVVTDVGGVRGVMLFPPGSEVVRLSLIGEESGIEEALSYVLVDTLEAVDGVKAVRAGDRVVVQILKPRMETGFPRFRKVLGSLPVSVAGCVLAAVLKQPVLYEGEEGLGSTLNATFRVIKAG